MENIIKNIFPKNKQDNSWNNLERSRLPHHVAIIMDGNGRGAQERAYPGERGIVPVWSH